MRGSKRQNPRPTLIASPDSISSIGFVTFFHPPHLQLKVWKNSQLRSQPPTETEPCLITRFASEPERANPISVRALTIFTVPQFQSIAIPKYNPLEFKLFSCTEGTS